MTVIPHLYDLKADGTGMLALDGIKGNVIVLSWLYERAARWVLDRNGIRGLEGQTLIRMDDDDEEEDEEAQDQAADDKSRVIDQRAIPNRRIYCVDLRVHNQAQPCLGANFKQLIPNEGSLDMPKKKYATRIVGLPSCASKTTCPCFEPAITRGTICA